MRTDRRQLWNAIDFVHGEMETVQVVQHCQIERRGRRAFGIRRWFEKPRARLGKYAYRGE